MSEGNLCKRCKQPGHILDDQVCGVASCRDCPVCIDIALSSIGRNLA